MVGRAPEHGRLNCQGTSMLSQDPVSPLLESWAAPRFSHGYSCLQACWSSQRPTTTPPIHFRTQVLTAEGAGHTAGVLVSYSSSSNAVL